MGEHVIVTGAAGGIGRQLVRDLVDRGFTVTGVDLSREALETTAPDATGVVADLTSSAEAQRAVDEAVAANGLPFGLVTLAGNNTVEPLDDVTDETWRFLLDVNLSSTFYALRAVLPLMRANGGGRVVTTSSIVGIRGNANQAAYSAAKAGVVGLTRALAVEYAPHQVTVNAVAPGAVMTDRVRGYDPAHLQEQLDRIPLGRFAEPTDVTRAITFLLGPDAGFFTGQVLSPNGGDHTA
ncbi:SDR family oxidoreductase [Actinomycetospora atypica]|uniref:SDR family oxidoreductase n=1 Tax=Actinomycetospora atypica TaxID=1290095 RepID=A0ABV9YT62_9PSEU